MLREGGVMGLIATSSIGEGETKAYGLSLALSSMRIYRANSKRPWPGSAKVYYVMVWLIKGKWDGQNVLDEANVHSISASLTVDKSNWEVMPLKMNAGLASRGVIPNGKGFLLSREEALHLLERIENKDVIIPYLIGSDLNSSPDLKANRFIINFWDWDLEKCKNYPSALAIVESGVKPERDLLPGTKQKVKDNWWLYEASGKEMFEAIGFSLFKKSKRPRGNKLEKVIAIARTSKTGAFALVDAEQVFSELTVVASCDYSLLGVLQSSVHMVFAWDKAGKMKEDLRYSPSLCFLPFPFPDMDFGEMFARKVLEFNDLRAAYMSINCVGLTKFYKVFHSQSCNDLEVCELRSLHSEIDRMVVEQYGWDISLGFGFHNVGYLPEGKNTRYTICEAARQEVLYRLAMLNKERYEAEQGMGKPRAKAGSVKNSDNKLFLGGQSVDLFESKYQLDIFDQEG